MAGKGLALLLADAKGKDGEEAESGDDAMLEGIAEDLLAAIKAGDASAVASALRAAHDECAGGYDEMDEE